ATTSSTQVVHHLCVLGARPAVRLCARRCPVSALPPAHPPGALPPAPDHRAGHHLPAVRVPDVPVRATGVAARQSAPGSPATAPERHRSGGGAAPESSRSSSIDDSLPPSTDNCTTRPAPRRKLLSVWVHSSAESTPRVLLLQG